MLLVLGLAPAAGAWDRPLRLSDTFSSFPAIDRHGTIRILQSTRRHRVEAGLLGWGKRRFRHCGVPGVKHDTEFLQSAWRSNAAGAMLFGWRAQAKHPRFRLATATPGHCFRRHTVIQPAVPKETRFFGILLAPLGTMVADWSLYGRAGEFFATAPIGGVLRRRGNYAPRRPDLQLRAPFTFIRGDRLVRTWYSKEELAGKGPRYRETVWGAVGAPRGGPAGKPRKLAEAVGSSGATFEAMQYVTDSRGGQVAGGFSSGGFRVMARRPGHPFRRGRVFPASTDSTSSVKAAGNVRGDAVFAWESGHDDVYALVRRRNGKIVGPKLISPGDAPRYASDPSVGIDGAGRAIVAYKAQEAESSQLSRNQIRVAICGRRRGFGRATSITGPPTKINLYPEVLVNTRGQAAVWFERFFEQADGNFTHHDYMVRARLRR
jgi:hypothetical protein